MTASSTRKRQKNHVHRKPIEQLISARKESAEEVARRHRSVRVSPMGNAGEVGF